MKNPLYDDSQKWSALSLREKIEAIRLHLCTGPCGQSMQVMTQRERIGEVLNLCEQTREELAKRMAWRLNTALQDAVAALKEIVEFQPDASASGPYEQIAVFCKNRARAALQSTADPIGQTSISNHRCPKCGGQMSHYRLKGYQCVNPGCPGPYGGGS